MIGSALTGFGGPNPNRFANSLLPCGGAVVPFRDIAPPETVTYGSQSTFMLKIVGSKTTSVIFMADIWKPASQWQSRYLWMPLQIGDGSLRLPPPLPWTLQVDTGETHLFTPDSGP